MPETDVLALNRREFLGLTAGAALIASAGHLGFASAAWGAELAVAPLPYAEDGLAPTVSAQTIGFHYGKHHKGYADNGNKLIKGTPLESLTMVEIIRQTAGKPEQQAVFNNAAQVWNHDFYWRSMKPKGGGEPTGKMAELIKDSFGDYAKFKEAFVETSAAQFGSGYGWLVQDAAGKLKVIKTPNAENPLSQTGVKPLLTVDVWEHAYYLDYQNRRKDYLNAFVTNLIDWSFAEKNLAATF